MYLYDMHRYWGGGVIPVGPVIPAGGRQAARAAGYCRGTVPHRLARRRRRPWAAAGATVARRAIASAAVMGVGSEEEVGESAEGVEAAAVEEGKEAEAEAEEEGKEEAAAAEE